MPTRLSVCLSVCLLLSAASVSAQEVTATSMPASAPSAMPAASQVAGENVAQEQERLAKKAGVPFDKITPSMAIKLFSEGVFSQEELQWLNTFWAKDAERLAAERVIQEQKVWKKAKRAGLWGNVISAVVLPIAASSLVIHVFDCVSFLGESGCSDAQFAQANFIQGVSFLGTVSGLLLPSAGEFYYPKRARSIAKHTLYRLLWAGVTGGVMALVEESNVISLETDLDFILTGVLVYPLGAYYLYQHEYKSLEASQREKTAVTPQARLQLDIAPIALPTYDGNVSTGLGIVGSW